MDFIVDNLIDFLFVFAAWAIMSLAIRIYRRMLLKRFMRGNIAFLEEARKLGEAYLKENFLQPEYTEIKASPHSTNLKNGFVLRFYREDATTVALGFIPGSDGGPLLVAEIFADGWERDELENVESGSRDE